MNEKPIFSLFFFYFYWKLCCFVRRKRKWKKINKGAYFCIFSERLGRMKLLHVKALLTLVRIECLRYEFAAKAKVCRWLSLLLLLLARRSQVMFWFCMVCRRCRMIKRRWRWWWGGGRWRWVLFAARKCSCHSSFVSV